VRLGAQLDAEIAKRTEQLVRERDAGRACRASREGNTHVASWCTVPKGRQPSRRTARWIETREDRRSAGATRLYPSESLRAMERITRDASVTLAPYDGGESPFRR